ncbi:MAG: hypothetical protein LBP31_02390, partial [Holosporales bacterium]|nr:hypothetical protein [Holosporales bacterium]
MGYDAGKYNVGEYDVGGYDAGKYDVGEYDAGEYDVGEYDIPFSVSCPVITNFSTSDAKPTSRIFSK